MTSQRALLILAVLVALALRVPGLGRSLGHDEAYTVEAFASKPYGRIVTSYAAPNNHIFHTLLVRLSVGTLGKSNLSARLPALVAGLAAVPVIWLTGRALLGSSAAALVAAWILALAPVHVSLSQSARGYSLLVLLVLLSLWAAHRAAIGGRRPFWVVFGACSFLATWTIPSGAFHLLALTVWSVALTRAVQRREALLAGLLSSALVALAYLPLRQALAEASARWGVDVWLDPPAMARVLVQAVDLWIGGWAGSLVAAAAGLGLVHLARQRDSATLYVVLAWGLAVAPALLMGVAGQPRTYVYLLPTFVLAAALGVCRVLASTHWRVAATAIMLCGYVWADVRRATQDESDPYASLASHLATATASGDIVVSPFIMDVRVWSNASGTLGQRLVDALQSGEVRRLLFVASAGEKRFRLSSYLLKTNAGPSSIALPEERFELAHDLGRLQVWHLLSSGMRTFPSGGQMGWRVVATGEGREISVTAGPPSIGNTPTIDVSNPGRTPFQIYSTERFVVDRPGLLLLAYARTFRESYASVYTVDEGGPLARPHMYRTSTASLQLSGQTGDTWHADAYLLPVDGGQEFGVYILGADAPRQRFAELTCHYFPYHR